MTNPRKGSYGYTIRIDTGISLSQFSNVWIIGSASSNVSAISFNLNASTLFIGNSTVYSSSEGITMNSGEWCYAQTLTTEAFVTADDYFFHVEASATGQRFISPNVTITVDP